LGGVVEKMLTTVAHFRLALCNDFRPGYKSSRSNCERVREEKGNAESGKVGKACVFVLYVISLDT